MRRENLTVFAVLLFALFALSCKKENVSDDAEAAQTTISGKATFLVDNTIQPIVEDVLAVFHGVYSHASIKLVNKTETEIVNALLQDSAKVAVLPRLLTAAEEEKFRKRKITPVITHFATDAVALITNSKAADSVADLEEVFKVLQGKASAVKQLVFDNPNSSTVQMLLREAGVKTIPSENIYSLRSTEEVMRYVHNTPGAIGVVGVNWLVQPPVALEPIVKGIKVLGVNNVKIDKGKKNYYKPTQSNIATGSYPLTRKLYVLNYSGAEGLGTGFAIYISAQQGQRIILKSGLLPVTLPTREIEVRNEL